MVDVYRGVGAEDVTTGRWIGGIVWGVGGEEGVVESECGISLNS